MMIAEAGVRYIRECTAALFRLLRFVSAGRSVVLFSPASFEIGEVYGDVLPVIGRCVELIDLINQTAKVAQRCNGSSRSVIEECHVFTETAE